MKSIRPTLLVLFIILCHNSVSFAEDIENLFPKSGFIKTDQVNIKAGYNINFENLYKLKKNDPVKIIGEYYDWFKVALPRKAHIYIKTDFVNIGEPNTGTLKASRVNLRARPSLNSSVVGQASEPETITIISEENGWYEIEPTIETAGWIHKDQAVFKLDEI
ncbi:MAG: SH3 domain-containing protein [Candidatus Omnitrophota bacterium]